MAAKRLAITIAGAVSLGAYEAGVVVELLEILAAHNAACDKLEDKIYVDVLTGASAGGMTATIISQKLLFCPQSLSGPADNDLYQAWVKEVDIVDLLKTSSDEAEFSILSSARIEEISRKFLIDRYKIGLNVPHKPHPVIDPEDARLYLGLAMSNLNGITYKLPIASGGDLPYTRFQDEFVVQAPIDANNPAHNTADFWEPLRNAAVACGSFPFAFRPKELLRDASQYKVPLDFKKPIFPNTGMRFAYTDGGLFQNEPIGLAKNLVDLIDHHQNDNRFFLFIAPGLRDMADLPINAARARLLDTGKALVNAIFNQARYRDLEHIEEMNKRIDLFDYQAKKLQEDLRESKILIESLVSGVTAILSLIFPRAQNQTKSGEQIENENRLRIQFSKEYQELSDISATKADHWIEAVLLLETVAGLGPRDKMIVYAITDNSSDLAGGDFFAFSGFFDESFREHDYCQGRRSARKFFQWLNNHSAQKDQDTPCLGPIRVQSSMLDPGAIKVDEKLNGAKLGDAPLKQREALCNQLLDRCSRLMEDIGVPWLFRGPIKSFVLKKAIKKRLEL